MPGKSERDGADPGDLGSDAVSQAGGDAPAGFLYCVYTHSLNGDVFYVGQGKPRRPYDFSSRNHVWNEMVDSREDVEVRIVEWFRTQDDALTAERKLIRELRPRANYSRLRGQAKWARRAAFSRELMKIIESGVKRTTPDGLSILLSEKKLAAARRSHKRNLR